MDFRVGEPTSPFGRWASAGPDGAEVGDRWVGRVLHGAERGEGGGMAMPRELRPGKDGSGPCLRDLKVLTDWSRPCFGALSSVNDRSGPCSRKLGSVWTGRGHPKRSLGTGGSRESMARWDSARRRSPRRAFSSVPIVEAHRAPTPWGEVARRGAPQLPREIQGLLPFATSPTFFRNAPGLTLMRGLFAERTATKQESPDE